MSAAEDCIRMAIKYHLEHDHDPEGSLVTTIDHALRLDNAALADLDRVWRDTDTASLTALIHRAERAENELRTHLAWGCAYSPEPMTMTDEDGSVWRVEKTNRTEMAWGRGAYPEPWDRPLYRLVPPGDDDAE